MRHPGWMMLAALLLGPGAPPALAQAPAAPAPEAGIPPGPIQGGRRVPVPRSEIEERQRVAGTARPEDEDRRQLQDLNALTRQLAPPGTPLPAPEVESRR